MPRNRMTTQNKTRDLLEPDLLALYSENGEIARAMMEWRHRVVTWYVVTLGAVGSSGLWLYEHEKLHVLPLPFITAAVIIAFLAFMDNTNAAVLKNCYRVGDEIERRVEVDGGIYTALLLRSRSKRAFTYTRILRVLFIATSAVLVVIGVWPR
jgi:hypothetical protein